jgi:hypothetical protein
MDEMEEISVTHNQSIKLQTTIKEAEIINESILTVAESIKAYQ